MDRLSCSWSKSSHLPRDRPRSFLAGNVSNFLAFTPELGMIALGMTLLMISAVRPFSGFGLWLCADRDVDFLQCSYYLSGDRLPDRDRDCGGDRFCQRHVGYPTQIPSFLVTLGMLLVVRGTALYITSGFPQRTWTAKSPLMTILVGEFSIGQLRIHTSLLWFILFAIILGYVLTQTKAGNWIQAAGGNPDAARARGVHVARTKVLLFILTAVMSAYAGITSSIRVSAANPNSGTQYELEVIAMVVIGGTALSGGRGTIIGTVIGVLILRMMQNGIHTDRRSRLGL